MKQRPKWVIAAIAGAAIASAVSVAPASAAVTIGQIAPNDPAAICGGTFDIVPVAVTSGDSYAVPAAGTITSWSHSAAAGAGQTLTMKVFRPLGGGAYLVVGHDGPRPLSPGAINRFPTGIPVQAGDVLGLNTANASAANSACGVVVGAGNLHTERSGDLADGASDVFPPPFGTTRANIAAVVEPSNSFSFVSASRNKKKGTAALTVNVPNPGELTAAGKGVKAASSGAVTSQAVAGAGEVTLAIKAKGKTKKRLKQRGKAKVKLTVFYTPTGGEPAALSTKLKLKLKRKKRSKR